MDSAGTIEDVNVARTDTDFCYEGASLLQQGRSADAVTNLQRAFDSDPGDSNGRRLPGGALASSEDFAGVSAMSSVGAIRR